MKKYYLMIFGIFVSFIAYSQIDGPYILHEGSDLRIIRTDNDGNVQDSLIQNPAQNQIFEVQTSDGKDSFNVKLHPFVRPPWKIKQAEKLFITSDPHGNFDCFAGILKAGGVIDENFHWKFGNNQLMVIGDVFDRGKDVLPIFWLLYQLEQEAGDAGGNVLFLLGNHEEMVLRNDLRYTEKSYHALAEKLGIPYTALWNEKSELSRWLKTRNVIQIVGSNLFVHAGLSNDFLSKKLSIPMVNDTISHYLLNTKDERNQSELAGFLFASNGPLWYRGMVRTEEKNNPLNTNEFKSALKQYGVKQFFVGHTIFPEISGFFGDKLIDVNVDNKENREAKRARALLIHKNKFFVVYDSGKLLERF
jgi:hypothetical protein